MSTLFEIINNSTVAGLVSVSLAAFIGSRLYRKQKNIDRKYDAEDKLTEALFLMEEHCKAVNQSLDRLANTYIRIIKDNDTESLKKFPNESLPYEINKSAEILTIQIPEDASRAETIVSLYFQGSAKVENSLKDVFEELKKWHDFVLSLATGKAGKSFDLTKRVSEIPELSLDQLDQKIRELVSHFQRPQ